MIKNIWDEFMDLPMEIWWPCWVIGSAISGIVIGLIIIWVDTL